MDLGLVFGRGFGFPPRVTEDGRMAWSAGPENVREAIRIVLLTQPGERLNLKDFGSQLRAVLQQPNTVATRALIRSTIEQALEQWEPRINVKDVSVERDPEDAGAAIATVAYQLAADSSMDKLSLRLQMASAS